MAIRRLAALAAGALLLVSPGSISGASAQDARAAIFDLDFIDTSVEGASGPRGDETARLAMMSDMLRRMLSERGIAAVDLAPASARIAKAAPLSSCNRCDLELARELGAALSVTGFVHKTSNLILDIRVAIRDVQDGRIIRAGSVSIRGNTDESWSHGLGYLVRNRLLDPPLRLPP